MSAKTSGKSYKTTDQVYRNFSEIIRKKGVQKSGLHASFYLDAFYLEILKVDKAAVVARGLYMEDTCSFREWRDQQIELGLMMLEQVSIGNGKTTVRYRPGKLAIEYINKITLKNSQVATKSDVVASEEKLLKVTSDLQKQIDEMQGMLKVVAKSYFSKNPPHNEEREAKLNSNLKNGKAFLEEDMIN